MSAASAAAAHGKSSMARQFVATLCGVKLNNSWWNRSFFELVSQLPRYGVGEKIVPRAWRPYDDCYYIVEAVKVKMVLKIMVFGAWTLSVLARMKQTRSRLKWLFFPLLLSCFLFSSSL